MLTKITLRDYRGFAKHTIPLHSQTIIVGRNNAGKTTIIEALRLVSIVANRANRLQYQAPPVWSDLPIRYRGVKPSLDGIDFEFRNVCHQYREASAKLEAHFLHGPSISVHVNAEYEDLFALILDKNRQTVISGGAAGQLALPPVHILPPVGPLAKSESRLRESYVKSNLGTNLAPHHFRNQIRLLSEYYDDFVELAESTWPHLGIDGFDHARDGQLSLFVRDGRFVVEVGWVGHGLQTWL